MSRRLIFDEDYHPPCRSAWTPEQFPCFLETDETQPRRVMLVGPSGIRGGDIWVAYIEGCDTVQWISTHSGYIRRIQDSPGTYYDIHAKLPPIGRVTYDPNIKWDLKDIAGTDIHENPLTKAILADWIAP